LVKRPAPGETPIFVAARIAERKSRKSAPVFAMGDRLFPTISAAAPSVWLLAWRLLFIWVRAR
jgi:hypothetical protein